MFKKILVAVSASSPDTVLTSAIETARKYDARIFALHVVDPTPCFIGPADYDFGLVVEAMQAHGSEVVTRMTNVLNNHPCPADTRMVTLPMSGMTVGRAIASYATESDADLIVLGERKPAWWRWFNENVAGEVRRNTGTPIQVVCGETVAGPVHRARDRWIDVPAAGAR